MFHVPCVLVAHHVLLALAQDFGAQRRHVGLVAELGQRSEESFEVEDDAAREWQAAQGLPVDA